MRDILRAISRHIMATTSKAWQRAGQLLETVLIALMLLVWRAIKLTAKIIVMVSDESNRSPNVPLGIFAFSLLSWLATSSFPDEIRGTILTYGTVLAMFAILAQAINIGAYHIYKRWIAPTQQTATAA